MSRIKNTFAALAAQGKKGLIPFITAGDPNPEQTVEFMHALAKGGADVIELGVPFSDPMADGPVIQRSSERALARGVTLKSVLADVARFRETDDKTPVVLMGYANPIERMGADAFAKAAKEAGVDGVLVVDYPPEEAGEFRRDDARGRHRSDLPARADIDRRARRGGRQDRERLCLLRIAERRDGRGKSGRFQHRE